MLPDRDFNAELVHFDTLLQLNPSNSDTRFIVWQNWIATLTFGCPAARVFWLQGPRYAQCSNGVG